MRLRSAILPATLAVGVAATRAFARPRSFWELDDYIFGLSLHVFAPQASVPQPPFFPAFVFLSRFVRLLAREDVAALTWTSVVGSCASVLLVDRIARALGADRPTALSAALLFAFFPASWFYAGIPTSDAAGLAAALLVIWLSLRVADRPGLLLPAAAAFGLAFAIRSQTSLVAAVPLALAFRRSPARRALSAVLLLGASVLLLWAVPVLLAAYGWKPVVDVLSHHARYVATSTSPLSAGTGLPFVAYRWLVAPWVTSSYAVSVGLFAAAGLVFAGRAVRRKLFLLVLAVAPYCAVALLLLDSTFSGRYSLPVLPFIAIFAAFGAKALESRISAALPAVTVGFVFWSAILLVPSLRTLHGQRTPAEVAAASIRQRAAGRAIALTYPEELRVQAELLFPAAAKRPAETTSPDTLGEAAGRDVWRFGVASINDPTAACWPAWKPFTTIGRGRYLVVPYGPWEKTSPRFGAGFYEEEIERSAGCAASTFRWMGREARVRFPPVSDASDLEFRFYIPLQLLPHPPQVVLDWNRSPLASFVPESEWIENRVPLPIGSPSNSRPDTLTLRTSETFVPADRGGADTRTLGLQVRRLRLVARGPSSLRSSR